MVVVYHAAYLGSPTGVAEVAFATVRDALWCGVDLFFVLSGFLITRILLATVGSPRYFSSFYLRRTVRIFPLYYGVLLALFVGLPAAAWLVGGPVGSAVDGESYGRLWSGQAWLWLYLQNFLQAGGPSRLPGLGHFWSLAIEEQFYLVWPAAVWLVGRGESGPRRVAWLCGAMVVGAPVIRAALLAGGAEPWAVFHWTHTRCDGLAWGGLAAAADASRWGGARRSTRSASLLPLAGFLVCGVVAGGGMPSWDKLVPAVQVAGYSLIAMAFAAWVFRLATDENPQRGGWLASRWLRTIGRLSYAMYVFHWPLCRAWEAVLDRLNPAPLPGVLLQVSLVTATSFALAWLSWHAWEKHWLRLKRYAPY